jgi:hypothetical protein
MKLKNIIITLIGLVFFVPNSKAWDEVTHAYMTKMIPGMVNNPALINLLNGYNDYFIAGSWFTDTYQYTGKNQRVEAINPHNFTDYDSVFIAYLQDKDVKKQNNYNELLAFYLGSLAHLAEDLWFDSNLDHYQRKKKDRFKGDSDHGAFIAKQYGYIGIHVNQYIPYTDLFHIYSKAGLLPDSIKTEADLEKTIKTWAILQYKQLTALKLLNFVAGNQLYSASPWTAANLYNAPGGMSEAASVAALFVECTWNRIQNKPVNDILITKYFWTSGEIAFLMSSPEAVFKYSSYKGILIDENGDTINGKFNTVYPNAVVRSFGPNQPLIENNTYYFVLIPAQDKDTIMNPEKYMYSFTANYDHNMDTNLATKKPWYNTLGLGMFGFIPVLAFAGILFGISGIIKMKNSLQKRNRRLIIQRIFQFAGVIILGVAFYMLFSKGWIIIEIAL